MLIFRQTFTTFRRGTAVERAAGPAAVSDRTTAEIPPVKPKTTTAPLKYGGVDVFPEHVGRFFGFIYSAHPPADHSLRVHVLTPELGQMLFPETFCRRHRAEHRAIAFFELPSDRAAHARLPRINTSNGIRCCDHNRCRTKNRRNQPHERSGWDGTNPFGHLVWYNNKKGNLLLLCA